MSSRTPRRDARPASFRSKPAPHGRAGLIALTIAIAIAIIAVDQFTKYLAQHNLVLGDAPVPVIGDLLTFQLIYNSGAALSIGTGVTWVLTIIVAVVIAVIVWAIRRIGSRGWAVALGLLLGGAIGNLIDRLMREPGFGRGHVVDFIGYGSLFVGNFADIAIVAAAVTIGILAVLGVGISGERVSDEPRHLRKNGDAPAPSEIGGQSAVEPGGAGDATADAEDPGEAAEDGGEPPAAFEAGGATEPDDRS